MSIQDPNANACPVSIITVTRNDLAGLRRTFSAIQALARPVQWYVVDGASTDGTADFLAHNRSVSKFLTEPDSGIYEAMRKGLMMASTNYVIFLNSGDLIDSDAFGTACSLLTGKSGFDVVYFSSRFCVDGHLTRIRRARDPRAIWHSVPANQQATIFSRELAIQVGFPTNYRICGDYALVAKMYCAGARAISHPDVVLGTFELGGVSTRRMLLLCKEAFSVQRDVLRLSVGVRAISAFRRVLAVTANYVQFRLVSLLKSCLVNH